MGLGNEASSYQVGDQLLPETLVWDSSLHPLRLTDLLSPEARVVVVIIFGGAAKRLDPTEPYRGGLWCQDSYQDLRLQKALIRSFRDRPVQFLAIAVPPVFGSATHGYRDGGFLSDSESSDYLAEANAFIRATRQALRRGVLPFAKLYFDPRFELGRKPHLTSTASHPVATWKGKLKWHLDGRKYGLPTLWLLNSAGQILREPFYGNDYGETPPKLEYDFDQIKASVEAYLDR